MSGGRFGYMDSSLKSEIFGWQGRVSNVFEDLEVSRIVWDVLDLIHEFDYYKSGDTDYDTYAVKKEQFKEKWLGTNKTRVKRIVDEALEECRSELYETYGIEDDESRR